MYKTNSKKILLVMLEGEALSPCYEFQSATGDEAIMPFDIFTEILKHINQSEAMAWEVVFLLGFKPVPHYLRSILSVASDNIVLPLMSREEQEEKGIPSSIHQTVIVNDISLLNAKWDDKWDDLRGRPLIIKVRSEQVEEIKGLLIQEEKEGLGNICLQPVVSSFKSVPSIAQYKQMLFDVSMHYLRNASAGSSGRLSNVFGQKSIICPAPRETITVGPDGLVYLCPAYYRMGSEGALGTFKELSEILFTGDMKTLEQRGIDITGAKCCYAEKHGGNDMVCELCDADDYVRRQITKKAGESGILLDMWRVQESESISIRSDAEGDEDLYITGTQVHDADEGTFLQAIRDIQSAIESVSKGNSIVNEVRTNWQEDYEISSTSRLAVFKRRVSEVLAGIEFIGNKRIQDEIESTDSEKDLELLLSEIDTTESKTYKQLSERDLSLLNDSLIELMGWQHILTVVVADKSAGFNLDGIEKYVRNRLESAEENQSKLFKDIIRKNAWPQRDGWVWDVDLNKGTAEEKRAIEHMSMRPNYYLRSLEGYQEPETKVGVLSGIDSEIVRRLYERREDACNGVKEELLRVDSSEDNEEQIRRSIRMLGVATKNLSDWFFCMAGLRGWERGKHGWLIKEDFETVYAMGDIEGNALVGS